MEISQNNPVKCKTPHHYIHSHKRTIFGPRACITKEEKIHITTAELVYDLGSVLNLGNATIF
jgi:hypothetical protein